MLWEYEETFRVAQGALETGPANAPLQNRFETFFLIRYIALVIMRLLQEKTGRRFSCEEIVDCLNSVSCTNEQDNIYVFDYRSEVSDAIGEALGIDFTKKRLRLSKIKHILADSKR
jgi:hypothetical protein